jgi:hypothetical protein
MDIKTIITQNPSIINIFNEYYPELNFNDLDTEIAKDIIETIIETSIDNLPEKITEMLKTSEKDIIEENYEKADKYIPEMMMKTELIFLKGKINNIPITILFDTGATQNCIYKSKAVECGLQNIIDKRIMTSVAGIHNVEKSHGVIWYTDLEMDVGENKTKALLGINLIVIDDVNIKKNEKILDVILGLNFMKSYRANIDFLTNTITLNGDIKIKFN